MNVSDRLRAALVVGVLLLTATAVRADDRVKAETRVDQVRAEYGLTGEGVIIAILDRGIDYTHPDFINMDGTTRILAIYDLTDPSGAGDPDNPTGVGTVYTRDEINAALAGGPALATRDAVGHGTSTAGLTGGNGSASGGEVEGMAPNATFVIVKFTTEGAPAHDGEPAEAPFYNPALFPTALDYVLGLADDVAMPAVFLANFGSSGGPMDGTSAFARAIDSRFGAGIPGRVFVTGTSDDGGVLNHAGGTVGQGQTAEIQIQKGYTGFLRFNLWYPDSDRFGVEIITPSGASGALPTPPGNTTQASASGTGYTYFHNGSSVDFFGATSPTREILIDFSGAAGTYTIRLTGTTVTGGRFDASLNPSNFYAQPNNRFLTFAEEGYQVWDGAAAFNNIAPHAYVLRTSYLDIDGITRSNPGNEVGEGELWPGSGIGPTYDGRLGVTVGSPGQSNFTTYAPRSYFAAFRNNLLPVGDPGFYGVQSAVSGASPVVTGIIALLLEADPTLDQIEMRDILEETAREDAFTGAVPSVEWGYGKIDAYAAATAVLKGVAVEPGAEQPETLGLSVAPNPFSQSTRVTLDLAEAQHVRVALYDALGRRVATLQDGPLAAGAHTLTLDDGGLPAGVYLVRAIAAEHVITRRVTVLR